MYQELWREVYFKNLLYQPKAISSYIYKISFLFAVTLFYNYILKLEFNHLENSILTIRTSFNSPKVQVISLLSIFVIVTVLNLEQVALKIQKAKENHSRLTRV